jgi:dTDP-4-amino-4,6-dideoxygalactose transaminase
MPTPINVTRTFLPPVEEYTAYLEGIWERRWITNNGILVQELQQRVQQYLRVPYLQIVNNGMIALQIAIKALNIRGEVITTPFSYVATTTSLLWEHCAPVFVDIEPETFCIDHTKIEAAITSQTTAILATHVYGYPCAVHEIQSIATKHGLKVIYDAAHAFGTTFHDTSLLNFGDIATLSFHATKIFHTVEGGALVLHDENVARTVSLLKSFGHEGDDYYTIGTNGKMSEFHAAMGLCLLPRVESFIARRKEISQLYDDILQDSSIQRPREQQGLEYNYAYYPIICPSAQSRQNIQQALAANGINTRRYFYPSLNQLPYYHGQPCPISENISSRVLCLPLYVELDNHDAERIAVVVLDAMNT